MKCYSCFHEIREDADFCPACGFAIKDYAVPKWTLFPGTTLNGKYLVGKRLGEGGFGITYVGWDVNMEVRVAIKEYYPRGLVSRDVTSQTGSTVPSGTEDESYQFYFFFGHAVASRKVQFAASAAVAMAVGGTAAIIVLSAILPYMPEGSGEAVRGLLGSYASIPVVVQSIGIFAFVYGMERSSTGGNPSKSDISSLNWIEALKMADEAGFGIYLIHMLFLRYFLRYLGWNLFELGAWTFIAFALGVYLLSGVLVALLRKASILARFQLSSWISRYDCLQ